jgi:hypothetical protein
MPSPLARVTPSALLLAGLACLLFTVLAFVVAFVGGNAGGAQTAMTVFVVGLVASAVAASVTALVSIAGMIAFPSHRGRNVVLLVLAVLCNPLLWLALLASVA